MKLDYFKTQDFHSALRTFFNNLNIPVNYIAEEPARPQAILAHTYKKNHPAFQLMDDIYFLGMVDDAAFEGSTSLAPEKIKSDYDGILIFGVTLNPRDNGLLPTRSQLADITRAFNREFHYTPVVVVFKYEYLIAFANAERLKYKQEWREGEKAGKVSLLRDVDIDNPHSGHLRILSELAISRSGKDAVNSFADLYSYWQTVFNVSLLNKKFYEELFYWYCWAIQEVSFPDSPVSLIHKLDEKEKAIKQEHNAKNVIRLLTRFLFVWFIKEKKLIPPELFDHEYIKKELLQDLTPFHEEGLFKEANIKSHYYKAILQNLFFATLNQETGKRAFRRDGQNMNVTNLMRYEAHFKNPQKFIDLVESTVPFMNGGLFECLDIPHPTKKGPKGGDVIIYKDGFSDRKDNQLVVPDHLFFGLDEEVDLSAVIGIQNKQTRQAAVKGLINIFESYKFTITENTPIEEDVALDPELLGKVFENLLASYNPETKTTARKQTGSFYTPREIVNYMVDESLIAYLKNMVKEWGMPEDELDIKLHQLFSFDGTNPFENNPALHIEIIKALDHCTIIDPACGSGAFPMGVLQKIVHVLKKLDPENQHWHDLQIEKALKETETAFNLPDKEARKQKLDEINEAFDRQVNDPDYARKLFLIENCIYGVDIQPIAAQITKLRFFISLVVDQKVDKTKYNFGIRALPNLETKFVAANTLIGIEKPEKQKQLFENPEVKKLEQELKNIRHRMFSAKSPPTKRKLRNQDKEIREKMGKLLLERGWGNESARQLAAWDPYDQNLSSPFFDPEWMFGIQSGFDIVIGNPPYVNIYNIERSLKDQLSSRYQTAHKKYDLYVLFFELGFNILRKNGVLTYITSNKFFSQPYGYNLRKLLIGKNIKEIKNFRINVFEATVDTAVSIVYNASSVSTQFEYSEISDIDDLTDLSSKQKNIIDSSIFNKIPEKNFRFTITNKDKKIIDIIENNSLAVQDICYVNYGCRLVSKNGNKKKSDYIFDANPNGRYKVFFEGQDIRKYRIISSRFLDYRPDEHYLSLFPELFDAKKIVAKDVVGKSGMIQLAFDERGLYNDHTVINAVKWCDLQDVKYKNVKKAISDQKITLSKKYRYFSILGLLNSTLTYWYFDKLYNIDLHFYPNTLQKMPIIKREIPICLDALVNIIVYKDNALVSQIIDAITFELYFFDHMKEKQIDILQFVEEDIAKIIQNREFQQLSNTEKESIVHQLNTKWSHPDSEVRNRIKLFAVRSPEILKPILESK